MLSKFNLVFGKNLIKQNVRTLACLEPPSLRDIRFDFVQKQDHENIRYLVSKVFLEDEPLMKAFKVVPNHESKTILGEIVSDSLHQNLAIAAKSKWDNQIKGVLINIDFNRENEIKDMLRICAKTKGPIYNAIMAWVEIAEKAKNYDYNKSVFEMSLLAVDRSYQDLKVGENLVKKSLGLARFHGFDIVTISCTNPKTEQIVRKFNFERIWKQELQDFHGISEKLAGSGIVSVCRMNLKQESKIEPKLGLSKCRKITPIDLADKCE